MTFQRRKKIVYESIFFVTVLVVGETERVYNIIHTTRKKKNYDFPLRFSLPVETIRHIIKIQPKTCNIFPTEIQVITNYIFFFFWLKIQNTVLGEYYQYYQCL